MKKVLTSYTLGTTNNDIVNIFKDGNLSGSGAPGVVSALEAIFVMEDLTKEDWLVYEDEKVYLVDRQEHGIAESQETEQAQELGCSTPIASDLCRKCKRNQPHEEYEEYKVEKKIMQPDECIGYIHKEQGNLF